MTEHFDFDEEIDRKNTNCLKYDFAVERGVPADVLPLWVADMDFRTAPCITDRIKAQADHGIFGYSEMKDDYFDAVAGWFTRHHGWTPKRSWLVKTPGVVFALAQAVQAFTREGDAVLVQQPVYYPFSEVVRDNRRKLVNSPLVYKKSEDGRNAHYEIDFDDFEQKIVSENVKMFLLCSPHNPVGRVWTEDELRRMEDICLTHGVIVVADEIHCDFVWENHQHHVLLSLNEAYEKNVVVCTAASKSFNIAGLQCSNIFIPDRDLRHAFKDSINRAGYSQLNVMGMIATQAAYEGGEAWLDQVKAYIWENIRFQEAYIREKLPALTMVHPEGTYLTWVDLRNLGLTHDQEEDLILHKAKLWLDSGYVFGPDGEGFERFNTACTRKTLARAMDQLKSAIDQL